MTTAFTYIKCSHYLTSLQLLCRYNHIFSSPPFEKAVQRPHLSNSSASGQPEGMWSPINPSSPLCTSHVIADPINGELPSADSLLYVIWKNISLEVSKWKTTLNFFNSEMLFWIWSLTWKNHSWSLGDFLWSIPLTLSQICCQALLTHVLKGFLKGKDDYIFVFGLSVDFI